MRTLMELRASSGDRSGALSLYDRFAKRLFEDMGVDPMPETAALRDRLQAARPACPRRRACALGRAVVCGARPSELAGLQNAANNVALGKSKLVFLCGEAGIGKSRLLREFSRNLTEGGWRVAVGTTSSGGERRAFQPLAEALGAFKERLQSLDEGPRQIIDDLLGSPIRAMTNATPRLVFDAIASAIETLPADRPLLLVCEDVHDADEATLDAVLFALRRLQAAPVYFVVTYRSDEVGPAHPVMSRQHELVAIGGANGAGFGAPPPRATWMKPSVAWLREHPHVAAFSAEFFRLSEGVPLVLQQVIQNWVESGERSPSQAAAVLSDIIASRTGRLSDDARTLLEVAAVAGDSFDLEVVRAVSGLDAGAAFRCMDELLERRLVRENSSRVRVSAELYAWPHPHEHLRRVAGRSARPASSPARLDLRANGRRDGGRRGVPPRRGRGLRSRAGPFFVAARQFRAGLPTSGRPPMPNAASRSLAKRPAFRSYSWNESRWPAPRATGAPARSAGPGCRHRRQVGENQMAELLARRARFARSIGDRNARREAVAALGVLAQRHGEPDVRAGAVFERGRTLYDEGETGAAQADYERALTLYRFGRQYRRGRRTSYA